MFNNAAISRFLSQYGMFMLALCVIFVFMAMPNIAHATTDISGASTDDSSLPFISPLQKLTEAIRGPVAFAISLIGIIAAGAILIFGGDMSGFLRSMVFLVLVIAIIVNASGLIKIMSGDGALIASAYIPHIKSTLLAVRGLA